MSLAGPRLAFDYATSRSIDRDGRLHVRGVNFSKATVNRYLGNEIPDWEELGLDPGRLYQMFRDPAEMAKAAPTFDRLPILSEHVPVSAQDHRPGLVVGSTSGVRFIDPYLRGEMVVWSASAIMAIDSNEQRELSAAYRYKPVMTPGTFQDQRYDGRMTDLSGNHIALVREGRVGPDCVVGDAMSERWRGVPSPFQNDKDARNWNRLKLL